MARRKIFMTYYPYSRKIDTEIALAVVSFYDKDFGKAIPRLKTSLNNKHIEKSEILKHLVYEWLYKIYDTLKITDSAYYYLELKNKTNEKIQYYETIEEIKQIDTKKKIIM